VKAGVSGGYHRLIALQCRGCDGRRGQDFLSAKSPIPVFTVALCDRGSGRSLIRVRGSLVLYSMQERPKWSLKRRAHTLSRDAGAEEGSRGELSARCRGATDACLVANVLDVLFSGIHTP